MAPSRCSAAVVLLLVLSGMAAAEVALVVFSDSLSDNGAHGAIATVKDLPAIQANLSVPYDSYWNERFSSGYSWSDYLLGHPFDVLVNWAYGGSAACPDVSMGDAFSGARPDDNMTAAGGMGPGGAPGNSAGMPGNSNGNGIMPGGGGDHTTPLSTTNTTQLYLGGTQAELAGTDRVIAFWIGGNEMNGASNQNTSATDATLDKMVGCIESSLRQLLDAGETRFAVGMPVLYGVGTKTGSGRERWISLMAAGAAKMAPMIQQLQAVYSNAQIAVWDVLGAVEEITLADPPAFGFTNNTAPCLEGGTGRRRALLSAAQRRRLAAAAGTTAADGDAAEVDGADAAEEAAAFLSEEEPLDGIITQAHCSAVDQYTYWDSAHPTAAAHLHLARSFANFLVNTTMLVGTTVSGTATNITSTIPGGSSTATAGSSEVASSAGASPAPTTTADATITNAATAPTALRRR